jgi:RNAse (barnase) inhibitor barstar
MSYKIQKLGVDPEPLSYINNTSITGLLDKPFLKQWAVNLAIEFIKKNSYYDKIGINNYYFVKREDIESAKTRHTQRLNETADIGSELHKLVEAFINIKIKNILPINYIFVNEEDKRNYYENEYKKIIDYLEYIKGLDANLKQMFYQFYVWQRDNVKQFLESERFVVHQNLCYAGTLDFIWKGYDDKIYCTDLKTSNSIYKEHELQCSAYKQARESMEGEYKIYCQYKNENWIKVYNYDKMKIDEVTILNIERDFFNLEHKIIKDVDNLQVAFNYLVGFYYAFAKRRLSNKRAISRN